MGAGASVQSAQLIKDISSLDQNVKQDALSKILQISQSDPKLVAKISRDYNAIPVLVAIVKDLHGSLVQREMVVEIFFCVAIDNDLKVVLKQPETGLSAILCDIVEHEDDHLKLYAKTCRTLGRLQISPKVNFLKLSKMLKHFVRANEQENLKQTENKSVVDILHMCDCLWGLAVITANRTQIVNNQLGIIETLVSIIGYFSGLDLESTAIRINALSCIVNCSFEQKTRVVLVSNENMLLPCLVKILRGNCNKSKGCCLTILRNVAQATENRLIMTAPALGLIPTASRLIKDFCADFEGNSSPVGVETSANSGNMPVDGKCINNILGMVSVLASNPNGRQYLASSQSGLMDACVSLLLSYDTMLNGPSNRKLKYEPTKLNKKQSGSANDMILPQTIEEESIEFACAALCLLAGTHLNYKEIVTHEPSIVNILVQILHRPQLAPKNNAILTLVNISQLVDDTPTLAMLLNPEIDIIGGITRVLMDGNERNLTSACELIKNLVILEPTLKIKFTNPNNSFLKALSRSMKRYDIDSGAMEGLVTVVWYLAGDATNEVRLGSKEVNILIPLVECLGQSRIMNTKMAACAAISCIACAKENEEILASEEVGLVKVLIILMRNEKNVDLRAGACSILSNLALSPFNKLHFGDPSASMVIQTLIVVMLEDFGDARMHASAAIKSLTVSPINKPRMIKSELGLLNCLAKVIRRDRGAARQYCCSAISNLAVAVDNKVIMGRSDLGIIKGLQDVIKEDFGESRMIACAALSHLATAAQNKLRMMRPEINVFHTLVEVLLGDKGKAGLFACSALMHMSMIPQNKGPMAGADGGFIPVLVDTIWDTEGKICALACSCIASLAAAVENRVYMVGGKHGVLEALVHVMSDAKKANESTASPSGNNGKKGFQRKAVLHACAAIRSLSVAAENKVPMADPRIGVVKALVDILQSDQDEAKSNACFTVWNLVVNAENQASLLEDDSIGLLEALIGIIESDETSDKMKANACGAILNFTICQQNESKMVEPKYGLVFALARIIETDKGKAREYATSSLSNLSYTSENKRIMMNEKYNLTGALATVIREVTGETRNIACQCLCRLAASVSNRSVMTLIEYNLLQSLAFVLKTEEHPCETRDHACLCLSYLSDCAHNKLLMTIPKLELVPLLSDIVETDHGNARTYSMVALKNLTEADENKAMLTGGHNIISTYTEANPAANSNMLPALITTLNEGNDKSREVACVALSNLAIEDENKIPMTDPELGLIHALVGVLSNEWIPTSLGIAACSVIWSLADALPNRLTLVAKEYRLLPTFVYLLDREQVAAELKAHICGICRSLAVATENKALMGDKKLGLVQQLIKRVYENDEANMREYATATLSNLSVAQENKVQLADLSLGLYPCLIFVMKHDGKGAQVAACACLHFMACHSANLSVMAHGDLGIIEALVYVVSTNRGDARSNACSALCHIASATDNRVILASADYGLLPLLVRVLREDEGKARIFACSTIGFLAVAHENQKYMASYELGLLVELVRLMKSDTGKTREYCCSVTRSLSSALANKVYMASEPLGLISALITVLYDGKGKARANACATICNLAIATINKRPMASPELGLIKALIHVVKTDGSEARINGCAALSYLAIAAENKSLLLAPDLGLLETLKTIIKEDDGKARVNACLTLSNLSVNMNGTDIPPENRPKAGVGGSIMVPKSSHNLLKSHPPDRNHHIAPAAASGPPGGRTRGPQ